MCFPNKPDLNPMDYAVCGAFNESITDENLTRWKKAEELKRAISLSGKNYHNVSLTVASMSGVVFLNVL